MNSRKDSYPLSPEAVAEAKEITKGLEVNF